MSTFAINAREDGDALVIQLSGHIDEDSTFEHKPAKALTEYAAVTFDWSGVLGINSCGIREWLRWVSSFPKDAKVIYDNCSRVVVNQINLMEGFLPKGAKVRSFYVPYFCEECEVTTPVLYSEGKEFSKDTVQTPEKACYKKCSKPAELDVVPSNYFRFLKRN